MERHEEIEPIAIPKFVIEEAKYVLKKEAKEALQVMKRDAKESVRLLKEESDKAFLVQAKAATEALASLTAAAKLAMNLIKKEAEEAEVLVKTEAERVKPKLDADATKAEALLEANEHQINTLVTESEETARMLLETARDTALILPEDAVERSKSLINVSAERAESLLLKGAKDAAALLKKAKKVADVLPRNAAKKSTLLIDDAAIKADVLLQNAADRVGEILIQENKHLASRKINFLDIAAHELRNPINTISLLLQVFEEQIKMGVSPDINILTRLRPHIDRLSSLIIDLLDMSRLERGKFILRPVKTNLVRLVLESIEEFKIQNINRTFLFNRPDQTIELEIDPIRISQVLTNLIDNAIKYGGEGDIEISIKQTMDIVQISITDHGQGIPKNIQKTLFKAFFRGDPKTTKYSSGLGLGLSICSSIVELHGGSIGVDSKIGCGAVFHFELPIKNCGKP